jgi:MFS transporter, DHA1 family, multidrug resistance protein
MMVVFGLVPILSPLIAAGLLGIGWHAVFWFHGFMALALIAAVYLALAETAPAVGTASPPAVLARRFAGLLCDRRFMAPLAVLLCSQAGVIAFVSSAAFVLVQGYGVSPRGFAFLFATVMLGQIIGAWVSSRLVVRHGIPRMLRFGTWTAFAASLPLAGLAWGGAGHWSAIVAPMALFMFAASFNIANSAAAALTPFPAIAGSASALLGFLQFGTGAAVSAGLAVAFAGNALAMTSTIALAALGGVLAERLLYRPALAWTA